MIQEKWKDNKWFGLDFKAMELSELILLQEHITEEHSHITDQINSAKAKASQGEFSDSQWFVKVRSAARSRGHTINTLSRLIKERRKKEAIDYKRENSMRWERAFIDIIREESTGKDFRRVCDLAEERVGVNEA
jgi:hypothetical protein